MYTIDVHSVLSLTKLQVRLAEVLDMYYVDPYSLSDKQLSCGVAANFAKMSNKKVVKCLLFELEQLYFHLISCFPSYDPIEWSMLAFTSLIFLIFIYLFISVGELFFIKTVVSHPCKWYISCSNHCSGSIMFASFIQGKETPCRT